jgi:hypothetical protein
VDFATVLSLKTSAFGKCNLLFNDEIIYIYNNAERAPGAWLGRKPKTGKNPCSKRLFVKFCERFGRLTRLIFYVIISK